MDWFDISMFVDSDVEPGAPVEPLAQAQPQQQQEPQPLPQPRTFVRLACLAHCSSCSSSSCCPFSHALADCPGFQKVLRCRFLINVSSVQACGCVHENRCMSVVTKENVQARREQVKRCGKNKENVVFFEVAGFHMGKKTIEYR